MPSTLPLRLLARRAALALVVGSPGVALLAGSAAAQGTEAQQQACAPDAVKLCSDTIPDVPKTTVCMRSHFAQLSPACKSAFNEAVGPAKSTKAPRTRTATRVEPRREMPAREMPARESLAPAVPAAPTATAEAGFPPFPSPDSPVVAAPPSDARAQIAAACRDGLIDAYTCQNTVPVLMGR